MNPSTSHMLMPKTLAALILLAAALPASHAGPAQDELDKLLAQKGLVNRLGDSIQSATDRAAHLVVTAMGALGVRYRRGGDSCETGFDCSGFVRAMYQQASDLVLPRRAEEQAAATQTIHKDELRPGDLVFFNTLRRAYSHVGIYVGEGRFIHSPRSGAQVRVESMDTSYWQRRFNGARRVLANTTDGRDSAENGADAGSRVIGRDSPAPRSVRLGGSFGKPTGAAKAAADAGPST